MDGYYSVSNTGKIRSNERDIINSLGNTRHVKERLLKFDINPKDGHCRVTLCENGTKKRFLVHRLVAEAFLENPNNYPIINHKDENPLNNSVNNLEWCTYSYNEMYNGNNFKIGDAEGTDIDVYNSNMQYIESFPSITKCSRKYNIPLTTLWRYVENGNMLNGYYFKKHL